MSLGRRLINTGAAEAACLTETTDIFGDSSGVALYSLDYDASDESGDYDGTPTDVEFGVGGQINYGASFNGSSSYIDAGNINLGTSNVSVSLWVHPNSSQVTYANIIDYDHSSAGGWTIQQDNTSTNSYKVSVKDGSSFNISSAFSLTANQWNHVVFTVTSAGAYSIYVDNGTPTTGTGLTGLSSSTNNTLNIGRWISGASRYWGGKLDQVRIFSKALSSSEVSTLYAEEACVYTCTTDTVDLPITNVAYYKLDNSAEDETTNANDGTWNGTEQYAFGRYGQAAVFNGSSSYIQADGIFSSSPSAMSASVWFKTTVDGNILDIGDSSVSTAQNRIFFNSGSLIVSINGGGGGFASTSATGLQDGNWHHIVAVWDDGTVTNGIKMYIDGATTPTAQGNSTQSFTSALNLFIGANDNRGASVSPSIRQYFNGSIDQVRIYSTALTSSQVTELYNEKQCLDTVTEPTGNLRFDEFWAGYDNSQSNRAEFKSSGQIVDFNTYSEGHAVLNQNAQTSGKYYLEIELVDTSEHDAFAVFNRSTNTVYDDSPYAGKNPVDANYGASLRKRGEITNIGNVAQSGFTDLNLGNGDIVCMAVNVDEKRIWWGRRDGLSDNEIVWSNGNPNGGYGGLEVSFVPSDVIVYHSSESSVRFSEFKVLNHADMLEPPFNFSYLDGAFTASLTENEANF